jgi:hypothetical protein
MLVFMKAPSRGLLRLEGASLIPGISSAIASASRAWQEVAPERKQVECVQVVIVVAVYAGEHFEWRADGVRVRQRPQLVQPHIGEEPRNAQGQPEESQEASDHIEGRLGSGLAR